MGKRRQSNTGSRSRSDRNNRNIEQSGIKQLKTSDKYDWEDVNVGATNLQLRRGIEFAVQFETKHEQQDVKQLVQDTTSRKIHQQDYIFYNGFKTALTSLLTTTTTIDQKILLIHGVLGMGKSSLARCLAYHLALGGNTAAFVEMDCSPDLDSHKATDSLSQYFVQDRWLILDQCNTNCIDLCRFLHKIFVGYEGRVPIVIFTSGHYPPSSKWEDDNNVLYKVISIDVDKSLVDDLMSKYNISADKVDSKDVLAVTTIFDRVCKVLGQCNKQGGEEKMTQSALESVIYTTEEIDSKGLSDVFLMVWPEFVKAKKDVVEKTKPEDWPIDPKKMVYFGYLLTGSKDPQDSGINAILNWLNISGKELDHTTTENTGYHEFDSVYYYFPCLEKLHQMIAQSLIHASPEKIFSTFHDMYNKLTLLKDSNAQDMRGEAFEQAFKWYCASQPKSSGVFVWGQDTKLTEVDEVCEASSVEELIKTVADKLKEGKIQHMWFVLNVLNRPQFPGYDFAYVQRDAVDQQKCGQFQLLQVTINPRTHARKTMYSTLDAVLGAFGATVKPYFIAPEELRVEIGDGAKYNIAPKGTDKVYVPVIYSMKFPH